MIKLLTPFIFTRTTSATSFPLNIHALQRSSKQAPNLTNYAHSKFASFGKTTVKRQSEALDFIESIEQASGEQGRMKSSLAHIALEAGILITPAHPLCFRYEMKS